MDAYTALADPTRRTIVEMLTERELTAGEIAARFPVSGPAISKHLRVLRETGLCRFDRRAQRRVYRLEPEPLRAAVDWMRARLDGWARRFDALGRVLDDLQHEEES